MKYSTEENFNEDFKITFSEDINDFLFNALNKGYLSAVQNHDPQVGGNNNTFGTDIYNFTCYELTKLEELSKGLVKVISKKPIFRLQIGDFIISNHKVGKYEEDPIISSFPNTNRASRGKPVQTTINQLSINFTESVKKTLEYNEKPVFYNLVLAHMGNPGVGLCAIYLCRPGVVENKKIKSWESTNEIWKRSEKITILHTTEYEKPKEEKTSDPKVTKKKKDKLGNE